MVKGFAKFLLNLTNTIDIIPFSINCLMYLCLRLICIDFSLYTFIVSSSHGGFIIVVHRNGWHCLWQQLNELISNTFLSYFTSLFVPKDYYLRFHGGVRNICLCERPRHRPPLFQVRPNSRE